MGEIIDSSYCTQIPATVDKKTARRLADLILDEVEEDARAGTSIKKRCEWLSWINPTWLEDRKTRGWILDRPKFVKKYKPKVGVA